ncbi:uncharacterized protein LOC122313754 [Carya illinoinensis]|uniref:Uncharacterized protein n=1 Tax=Carya illinoinensis TaxID=32201 RepID=A0A8T1Q743_CARIL|nr:uncharacterized protein LOC122313754 [Carya illinoinensis]KAG6650236.1 hypothetical protein CIPAW_06G028300 [Carya illinoinensis]
MNPDVYVRKKTNDKDDKYKVKAKAKGILEGYVSKMKHAFKDETIRSKLKPAFKKEIEEAIGHLNGWLKYVQNPQADDNEIKKNMKLNKKYYEDIIAKIKQLKQSSSSTWSS